jgi:5-methylcytosine-specific restriction endonuclease McrA
MGHRDDWIAGCTESSFAGEAGTCRWCAANLPRTKAGRINANRRWCGEGCREAFWQQHIWQAARPAALARDGYVCQRCGRVGWRDVPADVLHIDRKPVDHARRVSEEDWAIALGWLDEHDVRGPQAWDASAMVARNHTVRQLPDSIWQLVQSERPPLRKHPVGATHDLEVNHTRPRRGQGYTTGCHHHLDLLETLCRVCHVEETARQRRQRKPERDQAWHYGYNAAIEGCDMRDLGLNTYLNRELIDACLRGWRRGQAEQRSGQLALTDGP